MEFLRPLHPQQATAEDEPLGWMRCDEEAPRNEWEGMLLAAQAAIKDARHNLRPLLPRQGRRSRELEYSELTGISSSWTPPTPIEREGHPAYSLAAFHTVCARTPFMHPESRGLSCAPCVALAPPYPG